MRTVIDSIKGYLDIDYLAFVQKIYCPFCGRLLHLTARKIKGEDVIEYEWRYCRFCHILYWCPSGFGYLPRNPIEITLKQVKLKDSQGSKKKTG